MDAVFINPSPAGSGINDATMEPPLGLGYLASILEYNGFKCMIIDANVLRMQPKEVVKDIPDGIRLVGIFLNSFTFDAGLQLTKLIKKDFKNAVVIMGGPLPTASPQMVLTESFCDGVIRGEGEYAVLRIMKNIVKGMPPFDPEVQGAMYFNEDKSRILTNPISRITDLDSLPFPAYNLFPPPKNYKTRSRKSPVGAIVTSRGCAYACSFCSKDIFQGTVTYRRAENVLMEIDSLVKNYGIRQLDVLDDNFAHNKKRVEAILDGIIERNYGLALNMQTGIRTEMLDEPLLKKMKQAGFYKLAFGIESADPEVLRLSKKKINLKKVEETVVIAKRLGFVVYGFFIIGLPGETEEGFQKTMDFAQKIDFDIANFCLAIPFVGTELYRMVKEKGKFLIDTTKNIDNGFYGGEVFFEYENIKQEDVIRRYKIAYKKFYSFRKKLRLLWSIRTFGELVWFWKAGISVLKGIFKRPTFRNGI